MEKAMNRHDHQHAAMAGSHTHHHAHAHSSSSAARADGALVTEVTPGSPADKAGLKSGDVIIIAALQALHDAGALKGRNIIVFMTGDEEEAGDPERTFGLGRLFEPFISRAPSAPPLARVYLLVR